MDALQRFAAILRADLRARTRTTRFWVVLAGMMAAAWWCVPGPRASYAVLTVWGGWRGTYSSAWIGMALAMALNLLLNLGGFYLVRGTLVRDIDTRVWQLLVATPMTRAGYLLAKWASHMLVFGVIVTACLAVGLVAQLVRAEDRSVDLLELVKPAVLLTLPGLAVTAAAAIWFDLVPLLRRTAGNVLFFFLWTTALAIGISGFETKSPLVTEGWVSDTGGLLVAGRDLHRVREAQTGQPQKYGFSVASPIPKTGIRRFEWRHWDVRPMDAFGRLLWLLMGLGGVLLAAPWLDRFAARASVGREGEGRETGRRLRALDAVLGLVARSRFGALVAAEINLALRPKRRRWFIAMFGVFVAQALVPAGALTAAILAGWLFSLDIFGRAVLRELDTRTGALVFTAAGMRRRLLGARVLVGVALAWAVTLPAILRLSVQHPPAALAVIVGGASIALWGLALGALCRNARPFELAMLFAAYISLQGAVVLDAVHSPARMLTGHLLALPVALVLLVLAWRPLVGRMR